MLENLSQSKEVFNPDAGVFLKVSLGKGIALDRGNESKISLCDRYSVILQV